MKRKLLLLSLLTPMFFSMNKMPEISKQEVESSIIFDTLEVNYGTISKKDERLSVFRFSNTSDEAIVITEAKGSCGCTKASYSRKPIISGGRDSIMVHFKPDTEGAFYKKVVVKDSGGSSNILVLKGNVI